MKLACLIFWSSRYFWRYTTNELDLDILTQITQQTQILTTNNYKTEASSRLTVWYLCPVHGILLLVVERI